MAESTKTIKIPIQFQDASNSMQKIIGTMEKAVKEVDLTTGLGKRTSTALKSLQDKFSEFNTFLLQPEIDAAGLTKAEHMIQAFVTKAASLGHDLSLGNVLDLNLSAAEFKEINDYTDKIKELGLALNQIKKKNSSRSTADVLTELNKTAFLDRARNASKNFKSDASVSKNADVLAAEQKQTQDNIVRLKTEQAKIQSELQAQRTLLAQQNAALKAAETARDRSQAIVNKGNFLKNFEGFNYEVMRTDSGRLRGQTAILNGFMDSFMEGAVGGRIAEKNREGAEMILRAIGMDQATITAVLAEQAPQIRAAIANQLEIMDGSTDDLTTTGYTRLDTMRQRANTYMHRYASANRYSQLERENAVVAAAQADVNKTTAEIGRSDKNLTDINKSIQEAQALATELEAVSTALQNFAASLQSIEIEKLKTQINDTEKARSKRMQEIKDNHLGKDLDNLPDDYSNTQLLGRQGAGAGKEVLALQQETNTFKENLQSSIKHWMSAQQIINMVKDGIRQAYQDIKGLDSAMTNIAVVTDMSIDDLWGKINDYMAIAQEYGVTTQGVYEVSQLYYQQGLSTSEVMAATTETLKMARIAGMDYAEAADAMTVAIRAFKMEMSDAQHVTDVYSKVAAVTASDTEELAIAMSKTASSAESVGSSFENTTAMLAVMIETTRESAQNLGSALKSIISRYGEMKVGLSVDSEGEEIDYNKTDTALKSVGISLKDAQGQFRDFDEVIFELSEKWDSLDKNTQRYIATIMAGNRQQSRFIALVDNWERLDEVANSAQDSEDAGLIQYAKTLDSLESKLANVKTSFQQFYMSVFNGPLVSKIIDFINDIIQGFNHLSKFTTILNIGSIVSGIKLIGTILVNTFSSGFGQISAGWKQMLNELALSSRVGGRKAGKNFVTGTQEGKTAPKLSRKATIGVSALSLIGTGLSMAGSAIASKNQETGTIMSSLGSGLQIGTMVGMINPIAGVITGALTAIISGIASWPSELEKAQQNLEKAKEAANEANIKRAETKQRATDLESSIEQIRRLEKSRFESDEAEQAWIDANNALYEKFPELAATFQNGTDAIVDLESAEYLLIQAREKAAEAAKVAAKTAYEEAKAAREEKGAQQAEFEAETITKYGDENNTTWLNLPLKLAEHLQAERNKYKTEYGGPGATYDSFAFNKVLTSKTQNFSHPYTQLLTSGIDLYNQDMLYWLFGHENLSEEEILNSFINNLEAGTLKFEEGITADMAVEKFTNGTYKTASDLIASRNSGRRDVENAQYIENQLDLNQAVVEASTLLDTSYYTEAWLKELEGSASLIEESVKQSYAKSGLSFEEFKSQVPTLVANLAGSFSELYNNLYAMGNVDEFSSLIENSLSGQITERDFKVNAQQIFGFEDFDTFIKNTEDPLAAALNLYYTDFTTELQTKQTKIITALANNTARQLNWDEQVITNLLQQVPDAYYSEIVAFANSIESKIGAGNLSEPQANILIEQYRKIWENLANPDLNLDTEQLASAQQILSEADLFSITGITSLISKLKELGVDTTKLGLTTYDEDTGEEISNFPIYATNLITEYQSLTDTVVNGIHSMSEWLDKAANGMDLEDASKLAKMMDTNLADTETFEFVDGKWYAKNIDAVKSALEKQYNSTLTALNEETARQVGLIQQYQTNSSALSETDTKEVENILARYKDNAQAWGKKNKIDIDKISPENLVIQYLEAEQKALTGVYNQELAWVQAEAARSLKLAAEARKINEQAFGELDKQRRAEAQQLLASKGLEGYTSEEIATFAQDLGFENIQAILSEDGTYRLNLTDEQIKQLPIFVQNTINNLIQSVADQAIEDLESLGKDAGSLGFTNVQWTEVFTKASQERINYAIQAALLGNSELLENLIAEQYNLDIDSPEVKQAVNSFIASIKDSRDETVLTYFELSEKKLAGTLTASEELELTAIEQAGYTWTEEVSHAINNSGTTIFEKYSILMTSLLSQELPWDNIEDQLSAYFDNALEDYIKMGLQQSSDNISVTKSISDSENLLDDKTLKEFYLAYVETVGQDAAASFIDFMSMFTRNANTGEWSWDSTTIDGLPDIFKQALEKGLDTEELNKAIKADELRTSFAESYTEFMSDLTTVTLDDAKSLYESVFGEGSFLEAGWVINKETGKVEINEETGKVEINEEIQAWEQYQEAIQQAINGDTTLLESLISVIYAAAQLGIGEFEGIAIDSTRIAATLEDARNEAINAILDSIQAAFEGSLSRMDMVDLGEKLGINNIESYFTQTIEGYQATEEGMLKLGSAMVDKFGNAYNVAEQMYDLFVGEEALYSGYEDLELAAEGLTKEAENLKNVDEQRSKELSTQASILEHMANISRQMADDATFDFMGQDATSGLTQNADTFVESIDKVKDAFESFSNKEPISYQDFYNMMDFMNNQIGWDALRKKLGVTETSYEDFVNAVVAGSDEIGKVDMDAVAKLGVSVKSMSEGMQDSIKAVANDQIAYLKGLRNMLTAMSALEDIGEISIPLGFKITGYEDKESLTLEDILHWNSEIAPTLTKDGIDITSDIENLNTYANELITKYQQTFSDAFKGTSLEGFMGDFILNLFNGDGEGFSLSSEADKAAAQSLLNWSSTISGLSEDQLLSIGSELFSFIIGDDGKLIEGWQNKLKEYLDNLDVDNLVEVASLEIQQKLNNSLGNQGVTIKGNKITFNPEITTKDNKAAGWSSLKDEVVAAYEAQYPDRMVKFTINSDTEVIAHIIPKEVQQIVDIKDSGWVWQGDSGSESSPGESNFTKTIDYEGGQYVVKISATGEVSVTTSDPDLDQAAEEAVLKEAGFTTGENGNLVTKTVDGTVKYQLTTTAEVTDDKTLTDIYNLFTGTEGITVNVNTNAEAVNVAETLETIRTEYDKLKEAEDININIAVLGADTTAAQEPLDEVTAELDEIKQGADATITANISEEEKTEVSDFSKVIHDLDNTFEAVIIATEEGAREAAEAIDAAATDRTSTIYVNYKEGSSVHEDSSGETQGGGVGQRFGEAKGNAALSKGSSIDKLQCGAALAHGTLMGELGPELYVQGGHYYIAGANGPEFVDLANDAIVFNHLQTKSLLNKGQTPTTGSPVTSERRAVGAYATGNVKGVALASGTDAAIAAIDRAIAVWQNILNVSAKDLVDAGGGGGSGGDNKAYIEELQEWYNLSRKIANVEQEINNLLAERENIVNGRDYLNNLRETQQFLQEQIGYQEQLLIYQDQQLDRQAEAINNHEIWSQFLVVDENGLLQYVEGNEENGGKGALEVLADLNEMSAAEQEAYLASIGYTATDSEGNALTGQALVEQFFTDIQAQIDNYDALYDTVHETEGVIEGLKSDIEDINEEITENQLGLETEIYDLIVKAWEKEIEEMEKYTDLVKDANDKYIEGLQEALDKERELYERDESIKDRETLQRRLALLLRSGGSAQEIMSLEEEINDMLKDEYFANQQEAIDNIQDINEKQLEALEQEIKLEEEALAFQQENGLLWTKVNEIMNSGYEGMMNFFQANDQEFIKASALEQIEKIDEWAKRVGIYEEDKVHQGYANSAAENYWDNNKVWEDTTMAGFKSYFEAATDEERQIIKDTFLNAYANAKLEGKTDEEAFALAVQAVTTGLNTLKTKYQEDDGNPPTGNPPAGQPPEGTPPTTPPETQPTERYKSTYTTTYTNITSGRQRTYTGYGTGPTADIAYDNALRLLNDKKSGKVWPAGFDKQYWRISSSSGPSPAKRYATGGLVDYTGTAIVDGTPSRPEAFLDANQTAQIREALTVSGENSLLDTLKAVTSTLETTANNLTTNTNNNQSIQISEGAVKVTVETLADSYDIEDLSNDIFDRIVAIADKSTNRSVNRR